MSRLFFDLLVVLAIAKEAMNLASLGLLSPVLMALAILVLPFLLGFTSEEKAPIIHSPLGQMFRTLVACASFALFIALDLARGTGGMAIPFSMSALVPYFIGRAVRFVAPAMLKLALIAVLLIGGMGVLLRLLTGGV